MESLASYVKDTTDFIRKYDKQDQQGKAAFNERSLHMTQQQENYKTLQIFLQNHSW
jgi:hypothetical protein